MALRTNPLRDYRDRHRGETILVCGCGVSLNELPTDYAGITIGVNDVGRYFDPTYLVVLNPSSQFRQDRFRHVAESRARAIFTQLNLGIAHPNIVRFRLGERAGTNIASDDRLPYTRNSTYVALCLALYMGAKRIGLIGVDFTDDHFFERTGEHPLSGEIATINKEFAALRQSAAARGLEIINLSAKSRVSAFEKRPLAAFLEEADVRSRSAPRPVEYTPSVFFVNYRFQTCGDVFATGLHHAAEALGLSYGGADWDDPALARKVAAFSPDLLFVVHGRRFTQRWVGRIDHPNTAVWLVDEPYEVDDTAAYSPRFGAVFLNDYATLARHHNAHYLPVAYDPALHFDPGEPRDHDVGFIGGHSPRRERMLTALLDAGSLSYVVGGPWRSKRLRAVTLADWLPPEETARLYRRTKVVVNVFRERHHYNAAGIEARTLNPRVYEALACGAALVTEPRDEVARLFPALPCFTDPDGLVRDVETLLSDPSKRAGVLDSCRESLAAQTYQHRLQTVLETCMNRTRPKPDLPGPSADRTAAPIRSAPDALPTGWQAVGVATEVLGTGTLRFSMAVDDGPGAERGIASTARFTDVELAFELRLAPDAWFVAKIHQHDPIDQTTNSYHMMCRPARAGQSYVAMHNRVLSRLALKPGSWHRIVFRHRRGRLELEVNGRPLYSRAESTLAAGYCFLGLKGGTAEVRSLSLSTPAHCDTPAHPGVAPPAYEVLQDFRETFQPRLSIVTTVYDRTACLEQCLASVAALEYRDFEHIVVADHPPRSVVRRIGKIVDTDPGGRIKLLNLQRRHNDWGIAPAAAGLSVARGEYLCFLSDDNGYAPEHFNALIQALEREPKLGFAYSACKYAGRMVLRSPVPRPGAIDLGQPVFRRALFDRYLGGGLPFDMMAWDWYMIKAFMDRGVRWRYVNRETFFFRLHAYQPSRGTGT